MKAKSKNIRAAFGFMAAVAVATMGLPSFAAELMSHADRSWTKTH